MKANVKTITPDMAIELLKKNVINRSLSEKYVRHYESQMRSGKWLSTGDAIKVSSTGNLIDGQHRLQALINYGKPLDFLVVEGLEDQVFKVLDTGKNRSAADVLTIAGIKNAAKIAAAARTIIAFTNGRFSEGGGRKTASYATNADVLKFVQSNERVNDCVQYASEVCKNFRSINLGTVACVYFLISKKNETKADSFFEKYSKGIDLSEQSPIRVLRERLIRDTQNKTRLTTRDKMALLIMAWNNFVQGKKTTNLVLQNNYKFPKPI